MPDDKDDGIRDPVRPWRRCEKCEQGRYDVRRGPQEPQLLCNWCWFHSRPVTS